MVKRGRQAGMITCGLTGVDIFAPKTAGSGVADSLSGDSGTRQNFAVRFVVPAA